MTDNDDTGRVLALSDGKRKLDLRLLPAEVADHAAFYFRNGHEPEDSAEMALEEWTPFLTFHVERSNKRKPIHYARLNWARASGLEVDARQRGRWDREATEATAIRRDRELREAETAILRQPNSPNDD